MSETELGTRSPSQVELEIVRCFGWAIVETESTLYERYLHFSAARSIMTFEVFQKILSHMHSKGFVVPVDLHGLRAYRLLLVNGEGDARIRPKAPSEEMRLAIGSRKSKPGLAEQIEQRVTQETISASENLGADVIRRLDALLRREGLSADFRRHMISRHIQRMQSSLMDSPESLMNYVRDNAPVVLELTRSALRSRGTDFVLLTLRIAQVQMKAYR